MFAKSALKAFIGIVAIAITVLFSLVWLAGLTGVATALLFGVAHLYSNGFKGSSDILLLGALSSMVTYFGNKAINRYYNAL